jgi:ceramide glucosyltransferase
MLRLQSRSISLGFEPTIGNGGFQWPVIVGWVCLIWYTTVVLVCYLGYFQM